MTKQDQCAIPDWMTEAEWAIGCDLAGLYRLMAHFRWTDLIYTHISARIPGEKPLFLINRYGVLFEEMRASDLVRIDHDGHIDEPEGPAPKIVNTAGFVIHSAIHMARHDLACVIHTHTAAGIAVSCQKHGLLPMTQHALKFYRGLAYHGYEGIATNLDERQRLIADLGAHKAMILRNHGLLAAGRSIAEAFHGIYYLERACQAQIAAMAGGSELVMPPPEVQEHTFQQFEGLSAAHYEMFFQSSLRLLKDDWRR